MSDPPTQGTVTASGGALKAIGSFSARISVEGLFGTQPAAAKIVVYRELNADLLFGTAFFLRAMNEGGEAVSLGCDEFGYTLKARGQVAHAVTQSQAWVVNMLLTQYVELRRRRLPPGANYRNPVLRKRHKLRACKTPLQWRKLVKQVFRDGFRSKGDTENNTVIEEKVGNQNFPPDSDLVCQVQGDNRPGALFRLKERVHIKPGQTKKVEVYYPQPPAGRAPPPSWTTRTGRNLTTSAHQ